MAEDIESTEDAAELEAHHSVLDNQSLGKDLDKSEITVSSIKSR